MYSSVNVDSHSSDIEDETHLTNSLSSRVSEPTADLNTSQGHTESNPNNTMESTDTGSIALSVDGTGGINTIHEPLRRPSAFSTLFCSNSSFTWLYLLILGITCASIAFCIDYVIDLVADARHFLTDSPYYVVNYMVWVAWSIFFGWCSFAVVSYISADAIGSGIPEMKSILTGVVMLHYLSFRTFASKMFGLISAFGAGLSIGREGPYVHLASIVAQKLAKIPLFRHIRENEAMMSQMLNAGCAAGVSSTFGAPVGGVLFSMEVVSTYYMINNIWKAFFASVSGAVVAYLYGTTGSFTLFSTSFQSLPYDPVELIAFSFLGILMGLLGVAFIKCTEYCFVLQRKFEIFRRKRWTVVVVVAGIAGLLTWPFPYLRTNQHEAVNDLFSEIKLQNKWQSPTVFLHLVIFIVLKFVLTCFSVSLPIPAGVFTPVFAIGAASGRLCGEIMRQAFPEINVVAGGYAVVGAAALSSGVTRTISTAVIVFELTGQLHHMLPVLISVLLSVGVGNLVNDSFYDTLLKQKGLPVIGVSSYVNRSSHKTGRDIMSRNMFYLTQSSTYNDIKDIMRRSDEVAFPLVETHASMTLVGSLQRGVLQRVLQEREESIMSEGDVPDAYKRVRRQMQRRSTFQYVKDAMSPLFKLAENSPLGGRDSSGGDGAASSHASASNTSGSGANAGSTDPTHTDDQSGAGNATGVGTIGVIEMDTLNSQRSEATSVGTDDAPHVPLIASSETAPQTPPRGKSTTQSEMERAFMMRRAERLNEEIDWSSEYIKIDPAPFQVPERTPLRKVHFYFTMLGASSALVTAAGRLVGVISKEDLVKFSKVR